MLKTAKRTLIASLMLASLLAAPTASARILIDRQAPAVSLQEAGTSVPQIESAQVTASGFDWGDAGIGAAAALVSIGTVMLTVSVRRRQRHHTAMG
jgi:hypothetical protein